MLLTYNEELNIAACLRSLAAQGRSDIEVILIDAASTDRTLEIARTLQPSFPVPLRIEAFPTRISIGQARNHGVRLAQGGHIAFVSADAELEPGWIDAALTSLETADAVFGRQVHAPHRWTVGASVRGLRYHFPARAADDPLRFASNVAAAYSREILDTFPFHPDANAAEDLLLARRAAAAGHVVTYRPDMVVRHHDVLAHGQEWNKSVREGYAWGLHAAELGLFVPVIVWGLLLLVSAALLTWRHDLAALLLFASLLWAPALRRALRPHPMPLAARIKGVAASPFFDVAFLISYAWGLVMRRTTEGAAGSGEVHA